MQTQAYVSILQNQESLEAKEISLKKFMLENGDPGSREMYGLVKHGLAISKNKADNYGLSLYKLQRDLLKEEHNLTKIQYDMLKDTMRAIDEKPEPVILKQYREYLTQLRDQAELSGAEYTARALQRDLNLPDKELLKKCREEAFDELNRKKSELDMYDAQESILQSLDTKIKLRPTPVINETAKTTSREITPTTDEMIQQALAASKEQALPRQKTAALR